VGGLEVIKRKLLSLLSILLIPVMSASEQAKPAEGEDLAKAAQNPIASLVSVPLQNNNAFGIGPFDRNQNAFLVPEEAKIMTFVVGRAASSISGTAAGTAPQWCITAGPTTTNWTSNRVYQTLS
jgi:hypothetical protein